MGQRVAVVANGEQSLRVGRGATAENLAQHRRVALPCGRLRFQRKGGAALAEQTSVAARVEWPDRLLRDQPDVMVVEHHLRLDRRVVSNGDRTVGLAVAQRLRGLDHRQRSPDAVVGDAGIRALEPVADADVSEHIVRQRAQQPHGVDGVGQLAAEARQLVASFGQQREIVVLALVAAAAGSYVHTGAVVVFRRCGPVERVAVRDDPGTLDRLARGVQTEQIGAPDQLVQLPILDQLASIEVGDLARHLPGPRGGIPLTNRRDRRAARAHGFEDRFRGPAGGAHCAGAGDDDSWLSHGWMRPRQP